MTAPTDLHIAQLSKRFRDGTLANDHLDLDLGPGEVFGLLGPNGAGKSTLVKQIIGLLRPTSGSIRLNGHDLVEDPATARRLCSYLPQGTLPIDSFTPDEIVELIGRIRGGDRQTVQERRDALFAALEIEQWRSTMGARLSGGVRRLVGFVMAVVWPAPLTILDEPTNDIDPLRRRLMWQEIRRLGDSGIAVLLVTHNVLEAEQAVDRLAVIDRGRILAQGTPASLKSADRGRLRLQLSLAPGTEAPEAPAFANATSRIGNRLRLLIAPDSAVDALHWSRDLVDAGRAEEFQLSAVSLEDTYLRLIGRGDALDVDPEETATGANRG